MDPFQNQQNLTQDLDIKLDHCFILEACPLYKYGFMRLSDTFLVSLLRLGTVTSKFFWLKLRLPFVL